MDSEITLRMENWRGGDSDETQNDAHIMRRQGCAMQNQGITLIELMVLIIFQPVLWVSLKQGDLTFILQE